MYLRVRGLPLRDVRKYLLLGEVIWELKCFTLLLRECCKVRDHTALKCQLIWVFKIQYPSLQSIHRLYKQNSHNPLYIIQKIR